MTVVVVPLCIISVSDGVMVILGDSDGGSGAIVHN